MAYELKVLLAMAVMAVNGLPAYATEVPDVTGFVAEQPAINQTRFILLFDVPIENLEKDDFEYTAGCSLGYLEIQGATAQIELVDCPTGLVTLTLKASSMGLDTKGPKSDLKFETVIDATEPTASFSEIQIEGSGPFTYTTILRFSEIVEFDVDRLRFASNTSCNTSIIPISGGLRLRANCDHAELSWTLPARSLQDNAGHLGPYRDVRVSVSNPEPAAPPPTQTPAPVLPVTPVPPQVVMTPPVAPIEPVPTIQPTVSSAVSESSEQVFTEATPEPIQEPVFISITPAATGGSLLANAVDVNILEQFQQEPQLSIEETSTTIDAITRSADPKDAVETVMLADEEPGPQRQDNSFGVWLIGLGSAIFIAVGLLRRFSGR